MNPTAFRVPVDENGRYKFGNLGRNTLQEDGIFNWDVSLAKNFQLSERFGLQFRWEAFNVTNHPSYGTPNRNIENPDFGTVRSTHSTPRQMQFGLRLTW